MITLRVTCDWRCEAADCRFGDLTGWTMYAPKLKAELGLLCHLHNHSHEGLFVWQPWHSGHAQSNQLFAYIAMVIYYFKSLNEYVDSGASHRHVVYIRRRNRSQRSTQGENKRHDLLNFSTLCAWCWPAISKNPSMEHPQACLGQVRRKGEKSRNYPN